MRVRIFNATLVLALALSMISMFFVKTKVIEAEERIKKIEAEIAKYEDRIQVLRVEWVYLTRPERIRSLSNKYLKENGYTMAKQIHAISDLKGYYLAKYGNAPKESASRLVSDRRVEIIPDNIPEVKTAEKVVVMQRAAANQRPVVVKTVQGVTPDNVQVRAPEAGITQITLPTVPQVDINVSNASSGATSRAITDGSETRGVTVEKGSPIEKTILIDEDKRVSF